MRTIWALFKKELRLYFVSPIAYGLIAGFLIITGFFFYFLLSMFLESTARSMMMAQYYRQMPPPVNVNLELIRPLISNFAFLGLIMGSMITMRLIAEEKKLMTIELILTSPVTTFQLVMGKFLAGFALFCIMLLPTSLYFIILDFFGDPEITPIIIGYIGLLLIGGVFTAIGLMVSSFTENQLIAVALTLSISVLLWVVDWPVSYITQPTVSAIVSYIALPAHFDDFTKGVLDIKHISYFLSLIILSLYLTYRSLESLRWRT